MIPLLLHGSRLECDLQKRMKRHILVVDKNRDQTQLIRGFGLQQLSRIKLTGM
jgi:hypothetical protein